MKTEKQSAEVGAIVGRFQVPELHDAHKELIQKVCDTHPRVLVFIGLAADACKCTYNNPLDFPTRKAMIEKVFPNVEVLYIKDRGNDELWSKELDSQIAGQVGPGKKVVLYGSRDSFIPHYKGRYLTEELVPTRFISGKEIRKNVGIRSKGTAEFREGVIWAVENQWPGIHPTVDGAIVDWEREQTLLAKKPGETLLRFVGGFSDADSGDYEADVLREIQQETGLIGKNARYVGSRKIDDWRFRGERNKIKTILFLVDDFEGMPKADDDVEHVEWVPLNKLAESLFVNEHKPLFQLFKEKILIPFEKANAGVGA